MSKPKFVPPTYRIAAFNCPHCGVFAHQKWGDICAPVSHLYGVEMRKSMYIATCAHCGDQSIWVDEKMVAPDSGEVSMPNEDLSDEIKEDYLEAASVLQKSPRAAAALLRLALHKLCKQLGGKGKQIQEDIDLLVEKGLTEPVLDAMDSVRIIGNEAVHPGQIDIRDNPETAATLFRLINFIAEKTLTEPKEMAAFYGNLPDSKKRKNRGGESGNAD